MRAQQACKEVKRRARWRRPRHNADARREARHGARRRSERGGERAIRVAERDVKPRRRRYDAPVAECAGRRLCECAATRLLSRHAVLLLRDCSPPIFR